MSRASEFEKWADDLGNRINRLSSERATDLVTELVAELIRVKGALFMVKTYFDSKNEYDMISRIEDIERISHMTPGDHRQ